MTLRITAASQLPKALRVRLEAEGMKLPPRKPKASRAGLGDTQPSRHVCHRCGARFDCWADAEKHALTTGHIRIECELS